MPNPQLAPASAGATDAVIATTAQAIFDAASRLLPALEAGETIDAARLRCAMTEAFGGSDAEGGWAWKSAYDACEAAQVAFLNRYGTALDARQRSAQKLLSLYERIAGRFPTHTRRSETSLAFQQYSTPLPLAMVASIAAGIVPADLVLEPSAGTGMLAIHAHLAGARLLLNELEDDRADLLALLFPGVPVHRHDAATIDDRLPGDVVPSVVLLNPPFSAVPNVDRQMKGVRRQNIWHNSRRKLAECGPRPGVDIKRRSCGGASGDVRWSSV